MDEHEKKIIEFVFQAGTALGGLILVFLAASLASFDTFDSTEKRAVRAKYRKRAWTGVGGLFASLASAILSLAAYEWMSGVLLDGALIALFVAFGAISWAAIQAATDIG